MPKVPKPKVFRPKNVKTDMVDTFGKKSGTSTIFAEPKPDTRKKPKKPPKGAY
jgi:hypothetical protein